MTLDEISALTLEIVTIGVQWVLVPLILAGVVVLARSLVARAEEGEPLTSARAGGWAGLLLFFLYFVHSLPEFRVPGLDAETGMVLHVWGIAFGAALGFAALFGLTRFAPGRVVGFVVLLLTFSGLLGFHSYVFLESRNEFIVGLALGSALGTLLHMMVFPESLRPRREEPSADGAAPGYYRGAPSSSAPPAGSRRG